MFLDLLRPPINAPARDAPAFPHLPSPVDGVLWYESGRWMNWIEDSPSLLLSAPDHNFQFANRIELFECTRLTTAHDVDAPLFRMPLPLLVHLLLLGNQKPSTQTTILTLLLNWCEERIGTHRVYVKPIPIPIIYPSLGTSSCWSFTRRVHWGN